MSKLIIKLLSDLYHFMCFIVPIYLISTCLCEFYLNEDVSKINFYNFHSSEDDIYPSMTLCFWPKFSDDELKKNGINGSVDYAKFLSGDYFDDEMTKVDYDKLVPGSNEHLFHNNRVFKPSVNDDTYSSINDTNVWIPNFYTSCRRDSQKYFTIDVPYIQGKRVLEFGVTFDSSIFPNGIRPTVKKFGVDNAILCKKD